MSEQQFTRCDKSCPWRNSATCPSHAEYPAQPAPRIPHIPREWLEDKEND